MFIANVYRAINGGKFPTPKAAMKEVGGLFYTVKKIVQELQYNAKMPVVKEAPTGKAAIRKDKLLTKVTETISSAKALEHGESEDVGVECGDTDSNREAEAKLETPIAAEQTFLQEMSGISGSDNKDAPETILELELETFSRSEEPENNIKQKDSPMEDFKFDDLKQMDEQKHSLELRKPTREC
ncbi:hypothetical protein K7X08_024714 [Anisodus acutangulus]|uniref:AT3G52170-like helix-turn-helix domain-containing protein n=1 Tax=Anisodus acutangulus TaxID=402998 RepID=A0A9Q1MBN6_9SOLA|nr:hypothetical protein K7X08_024714 [Anisodus acutangulus]